MNEKFLNMWNELSSEEKNVLVCDYLKNLSDWDFKRMLCNVLGVEHYMDDEGLRKQVEKVINAR